MLERAFQLVRGAVDRFAYRGRFVSNDDRRYTAYARFHHATLVALATFVGRHIVEMHLDASDAVR